MHFFVKATPAPKLRAKNSFFVSVYVAVFFVVSSLSQLISFEDFPGVITGFGLPIDPAFNSVITALVVTLGVFAVPSLLQMKLSPAMRWFSRVSGWLVLIWWLFIGVWQSFVEQMIPNTGLFGADIRIPCGWWLVSYMVVLLTLNGYVAWASAKPKINNHMKKHR